jgi:Sensors of blue-light using FAD
MVTGPGALSGNQPITQILACSMATNEPTLEQLKLLYEVSAHNNRNRGLTGVLLYGAGIYIQWLEGQHAYMQEAWQQILTDPRHESIAVLWESERANERLFGDWVMGLRSPIVARDVLAIFRVVAQRHNARAMLREGYYQVFTDAMALLERSAVTAPSGALSPRSPIHAIAAAHHTPLAPFTRLMDAIQSAKFSPYCPRPRLDLAPGYREGLSSLNATGSEASSMFKNSMPPEHDALFDMAAQGIDDLLTLLDMPLRWALGGELWSRRTTLHQRPIHWTYEDKLVAVFDHVSWRVGIHPELTSVAYEEAVLSERLQSANDIPTQFRQTTAYALFWDYAESAKSKDVRLPSRFAKQRIRLRRAPPVPQATMLPEQIHVLQILKKGPERMGDLAQDLGLHPESMARLLKPFYASRSIETLPD